MRAGCVAVAAAVAAGCAALSPGSLAAQEWRIGLEAGRLAWDRGTGYAPAESSVALAVSRTDRAGWLGLTAALPVEDDGVAWAGAGLTRRLATPARAGVGVDLAVQAHVQRWRDAATPAPPATPLPLPTQPDGTQEQVTALGAASQVMALAFARAGDLRLELRGGAAGAWRHADTSATAVTPVLDATLALDRGIVRVAAEGEYWHDAGTRTGGSIGLSTGALHLSGAGGWWHREERALPSWSVAAAVDLPHGVRLGARHARGSYDPLHGFEAAATTSVSVSLRLGSARRIAAPVPASYAAGQATIRLRTGAGRGSPSVAGDFTGWQPRPMQPDPDGGWSIRVPLEPGVYHYAFVAADGTWFVPEDTPGRRDDGMGGHIAVLVVSP